MKPDSSEHSGSSDESAPVLGVVPVEEMVGDDKEDTALLRRMSEQAKQYLASFSWCDAVLNSYFGGGVGGIFAVFLFHIRPARRSIDPWIWIVVGDVPPAYLPLEDCKSPRAVFMTYLEGMRRWVELARQGRTGTADDGVPPINVPATPGNAAELDLKLQGLMLAVQPFFESADPPNGVN